jgi:hypothetical protein
MAVTAGIGIGPGQAGWYEKHGLLIRSRSKLRLNLLLKGSKPPPNSPQGGARKGIRT